MSCCLTLAVRSPVQAAAYSKQSQVDDMRAVLDCCGVASAIVVGHSMGGYDNMLFYHTYPQYVRSLVLYGTGPGFGNDKGKLSASHQPAHPPPSMASWLDLPSAGARGAHLRTKARRVRTFSCIKQLSQSAIGRQMGRIPQGS